MLFDLSSKDASYMNGKFGRVKDIPDHRYMTGFIKQVKTGATFLFAATLIIELVQVLFSLKGDKNQKPRR